MHTCRFCTAQRCISIWWLQDHYELLTAASLSFAPTSITVQVVGAGGISHRGNQNTIELLRLEPNGTVEQRVLSYKPDSNLGDTRNPPLRDGDGVVVDPHGWAKTNDRLKAAVEPLVPLLNAASIFRLLGTGF